MLLACLGACAAAAGAEWLRVNGREYGRVNEWCRSHQLESRWLKPEEALEIAGRGLRAVLTVDSRQAQINGVQVWLSFPAVQVNGAVCLARSDLQGTLQPLLFPAKEQAGTKLWRITLDAGHGGKDPGYCVGESQEKRFTLSLAQELRDQLRRAGFKVYLTRSSDRFVELSTRASLAKRQKAELFVSLHFNAAETSRNSVQGAQVFCLTPAGANSTNSRGEVADTSWCAGNRQDERNLLLAFAVQKGLRDRTGVQDMGVRRARFAVLREAQMPAVLIEAGFMSHPVEGRKIATAAYRHEIAHGIVDGLLWYKRTVERST